MLWLWHHELQGVVTAAPGCRDGATSGCCEVADVHRSRGGAFAVRSGPWELPSTAVSPTAFFVSTGLGIVLIVMALPVILVVILVTICVEGWAIRFAVLHDEPWLDAIARGWNLFTANVGKTLAVAFSSFLTQFVIWCGLVIALVIAAIPFIIIGYRDLWTGLIPGLTLLGVVIILSEAFFGTFASSVWTLGFMQLTGYGVAQQAPVTPPPPVQPMP